MSFWKSIKAFAAALFISIGISCKPQTPTAKPNRILVVLVGGLGLSQLADIEAAIVARCPDASVVSAGDENGYKADIAAIVNATKHQKVVLIGHSFGGKAVAEAARKLGGADLLVFIDPAWQDFDLPRAARDYLWFQRSKPDLERKADISGATPEVIAGDHNSIPHSPVLIDAITTRINRL